MQTKYSLNVPHISAPLPKGMSDRPLLSRGFNLYTMQDQEIWKDIKGYEGRYQVSSYGNVRNRRCLLKNEVLCGYFRTCLYINSKRNRILTHVIVATAYVPNPLNKPFVNHIDANKQNNHYTNLEWCTHLENIRHAKLMGLMPSRYGAKNSCAKKVINIETNKIFGCIKDAYNEYGKQGYIHFTQKLLGKCPNKTPYRYL